MPRWSAVGPKAAFLVSLLHISCGGTDSTRVGTADQRAALFDYIVNRTAEREAFSLPKNVTLGIDPLEEMRRYREDVVEADTEEQLFYALVRVSNARRDRHVAVSLVPGGLELRDSAGLDVVGAANPAPVHHAPIKLQADYGDSVRYGLFVSDVASGWSDRLQIGDVVTVINGESVAEYLARVESYIRYSTIANLWWRFAELVPARSAELPPAFYSETLNLELVRRNDESRIVSLPYLHPDSLAWTDAGEPQYPGFSLVRSTGTFDLHRSDQELPVTVLRWHGFRETLVDDVDSLMAWATKRNWLDHALIVDATRSRGGSRGAYAIQRITSRPFKTTFGNLRISDVIPDFIKEKRAEFEQRRVEDRGVRETLDDGSWLIEWLEEDVAGAFDARARYTNNVPFKLAHAPRDSDGILQPADVHFRGPLIVFSGPRRGSHLDQFIAIVVDNDLGYVLGMPAGGYSNTWEWEETLVYPGTQQPVASFMWSIGHTIRPNGEILEGNPAPVHEFIPITHDNFSEYYHILMRRALARLGLDH